MIFINNKCKTGYQVQGCFQIGLHQKDRSLLEMFQSYFNGVCSIKKQGKYLIQYWVTSPKDLAIIVDHFEKYPLLTQKRADYELFKQIFELINCKEHLTKEGLYKILAIKASMNNGLSDELKSAFPNLTPVERPVVVNQKIRDPNWFVGFTNGEGCFFVSIYNSTTCKLGEAVALKFQITQHSRDGILMESLVTILGCGRIEPYSRGPAVNLVVTKLQDITDKILPLFDKYPLQGAKLLDYVDFKRVAELMKAQGHLTQSGLSQIKQIKSGMNRGRID